MRARCLVLLLLGQVACGGSEFSDNGGASGAAGQTNGTAGGSGKGGGAQGGSAGAQGGSAGSVAGTGGAQGGSGGAMAGSGGAQGGSGGAVAGSGGAQGGTAGAQGGTAGAQGGTAGAQGGGAGAQGGTAGGPAGSAGSQGGSAGAQGGTAGAPGGSAGAPGGAAGAPGGSGGAPGCQCATGSYCRADTGQCSACADLGRLQFGAPTRVAGVSAPTSDLEGHARFPRPTASGGMLYRTGKWDKEKALRFTTSPDASAGATLGGGADVAGRSESAPWLLTKTVAGFGNSNLTFDRTKSGISGDRELVVTSWTPGTPPGAAIPLPTPLNTGSSNYSLAIAEDSARVFWMSTRNGSAQLLTMLPPVSLTQIDPIAIMLDTGCHRAGGDATPWVTPNGGLMLFRSFNVTPANNCMTNVDANDLYAVRLDATGQPTGDAINIVSGPADETDPALSADLCTLFFAREDADPNGGTYEYNVYSAPRQ